MVNLRSVKLLKHDARYGRQEGVWAAQEYLRRKATQRGAWFLLVYFTVVVSLAIYLVKRYVVD